MGGSYARRHTEKRGGPVKWRRGRLGVTLPIALALLVAFVSAASAQVAGSPVRLVVEIEAVKGLTINGIDEGDHLGLDVATGDINDDGIDDLIVGAPLGDPGGVLNAGEIYIFYGPLTPGVLDPSSDADVTFHGIDAKSQTGRGLGTADLNDDGVADLIIGAVLANPRGTETAGATYVVFGPIGPGVVELSEEVDVVLEGIGERDHSGGGVDGGDLNGDGVDDVVIGAVGASPNGRGNAGVAYVVFGPLSAGTLQLEQVVDVTIEGITFGDQLGYGVAVGDVNDDGTEDLVVGAMGVGYPGRSIGGATYVILGPLSSGRLEAFMEADATLFGIDRGDLSGGGNEIGDLNNDGVDDIIIGAQWGDVPAGEDAGETYLVFGPVGANVLELSTEADLTYTGVNRRDLSGGGVAVGDLDNDGTQDLIIAAGLADAGGKDNSGTVYVIFGESPPSPMPADSGGLSTLQVALIAMVVFLVITPVAYWWVRRQPSNAD